MPTAYARSHSRSSLMLNQPCAAYGVYAYTCQHSTVWYTPTDIARRAVHARRHSAVWHTPADKHCMVYACRHSAVWYTPTDIALYDTNPHTCNLVRCSAHACQRLVSAARSRFPAVLRCVVLMHNNSSCSSHHTAYTHTPADKHCMVCSCRQARCTAHARRHSAVWHTPADIALYGRHVQTSAM